MLVANKQKSGQIRDKSIFYSWIYPKRNVFSIDFGKYKLHLLIKMCVSFVVAPQQSDQFVGWMAIK